MITKDEFEDWKANPVTRWVLHAMMQAAVNQRELFSTKFFYGNEFDRYEMALTRGVFIGLMHWSPDDLTYDKLAELHDTADTELDLAGFWVDTTRSQ